MRGMLVAGALVVAAGVDCNCTKDIETYAGVDAFERECERDEPEDGEVAMFVGPLKFCDGTKLAVQFREAGSPGAAALVHPNEPPPPSCPWLLDAKLNESLLIVAEGSSEDTWRVTPMHQITWKPHGATKYQTVTRGSWCELPGEIL